MVNYLHNQSFNVNLNLYFFLGTANVQTLDRELIFSQQSSQSQPNDDNFQQSGQHSESRIDNVYNEIRSTPPISRDSLTTQSSTTPSNNNSFTLDNGKNKIPKVNNWNRLNKIKIPTIRHKSIF